MAKSLTRFVESARRTGRPLPLATLRTAESLVRRRVPALSHPVIRLGDCGAKVVADLTMPTGVALLRYGFHDPVAWAVDDVLQKGDCMIDAGANIGLMTLVGAARVGSNGRVVSCEPSPSTAALLKRNVGINDFHWVDIDVTAVGDKPGTAELIDFGPGAGLSSFAPEQPHLGQPIDVDVVRIDDLVAALGVVPALVKLDVEGAEVKALRGSVDLLSTRETTFIVEVQADQLKRQGASIDELREEVRGYEPYVVAVDRLSFKLVRWPECWDSLSGSTNLVLRPGVR